MSAIAAVWWLAGHVSTAQSVAVWWDDVKPFASVVWGLVVSLPAIWYQIALFVSGIAWVGYVASRPETKRKGPVFFKSQGVYWEITHNFWPYARSFDAENALFGSGGGLIGPLCSNSDCKRDVTDDLIT